MSLSYIYGANYLALFPRAGVPLGIIRSVSFGLLLTILLVTLTTVPSPLENVLRETSAATSPLIITVTTTPTAGKVPLTVTFTGTVTGGTPSYASLWDFGDGTTRVGAWTVNHTYTFPRNYTVEFWVQDSSQPPQQNFRQMQIKAYALGFLTVRVVDTGQNPIPEATVEMNSGPEGQQLLAGTTDPNGTINFGEVAAAPYTFKAKANGFREVITTIIVAPGTTTSPVITLFRENTQGWDLASLAPYIAIGGAAVTAATVIVLRRKKHTPASPERGQEDTSPKRPKQRRTR